MINTNDKKIKKVCSFYVSDFHLEMILLPYIEEKIKENKEIKIITENSLKDSMSILLSKTNIKNKEDISKINWENRDAKNIENKTVVIINGTEEFINTKNEEINENKKEVEIVNCFKFEEVKDKMKEIMNMHEKVINNIG